MPPDEPIRERRLVHRSHQSRLYSVTDRPVFLPERQVAREFPELVLAQGPEPGSQRPVLGLAPVLELQAQE